MKGTLIWVSLGCLLAAGSLSAVHAEDLSGPGDVQADDGQEWNNAHIGEFAADMTLSSAQGAVHGRFYSSRRKTRMEMQGSISITRLDRGLVYVLLPEQKMFIEQPISPEMSAQALAGEGSIVSRRKLAEEKIDNKTALKYEVVLSSGGTTHTVYQWMAEGMPVPARMEAVDGSWSVEYKNVSTESQPESLFDVPDDYVKMDTNSLPQDPSELGAFERTGEEQLRQQGF